MSSELFAPDRYDYPSKQLNFDALPLQQWPDQWHPSNVFASPQAVNDNPFHTMVNEEVSFQAAERYYRLGRPDLAIAPYRELIVDTIENNQVTVLAADTGNGKSSQLGLYLLEYAARNAPQDEQPTIYISQPRIKAARDLSNFARDSLGLENATLAGYLTGTARDSDVHPETRIIYVTEQLLFKMVNRGDIGPYDIIVNDEAHEQTIATVLLQGLMKEILPENPGMKFVISSATMDTEKSAKFYGNSRTGQAAPVIILPGRQHPITDIFTKKSVAQVAREYMQHYNLIVSEPGLTRQLNTANKMMDSKNGHTIHLLYGDQSPSEQAKALTADDRNHVVANKVGETSITPEGKDVAIDGGLSNIGLYEQGVRILKTVHSSKATMKQRRGRVGRTHPGIYINAVPDNALPIEFDERDDYDTPPIRIGSVASFVAELASQGRRIENMELPDYPTAENLAHDYRLLRRLGAIAMQDGELTITKVGKEMTDLPLDAPLARMLVAAREIDKDYDVEAKNVQLQVAAVTAIRQVNGILNAWNFSKRRYLLSQRHEDNLSVENKSDVLFELDIFIKMLRKQRALEVTDPENATRKFESYLSSKDIYVNRFYKAHRTLEELCRREGIDINKLTEPSPLERRAILGCQIVGTDELFVQKSKLVHWDIRGEKRRLGRRSTIDPSLARLVVGSAFDLVGMRETGFFRRSFIVGGSVVDTEDLLRHVPQRIMKKRIGHSVTKDGTVLEKQALYFDGEILFDEVHTAPESTIETREFIVRAMMTGIAPARYDAKQTIRYNPGTPRAAHARKQWEEAQELEHKSRANLMTSERYDKLIKKIVQESVARIPLEVTDPAELDKVIPAVYLKSLVRPSRKRDIPEILRRSPDAITIQLDEDHKEYLGVLYRNNVAYVTIPRELKYYVKREDLADVLAHHKLKIRIGNKRQYAQSETVLKEIEDEYNSPRHQERLKRRAKARAQSQEYSADTFKEAVERQRRSKKRLSKRKPIPALLPPPKKSKENGRRPRGKLKEPKERKLTIISNF